MWQIKQVVVHIDTKKHVLFKIRASKSAQSNSLYQERNKIKYVLAAKLYTVST